MWLLGAGISAHPAHTNITSTMLLTTARLQSQWLQAINVTHRAARRPLALGPLSARNSCFKPLDRAEAPGGECT